MKSWQFPLLIALLSVQPLVMAQEEKPKNSPFVVNNTCSTDLERLIERMLKDLPNYANRVSQRSRVRGLESPTLTYIILAGRPEFEPLPLSNQQYEPFFPNSTQQVFFTTLERQYTGGKAITLQSYHWAFLTQSDEGWRLVSLFSRLADLSPEDLPLPPENTTKGVIGQAMGLWLRDCRFNAIR